MRKLLLLLIGLMFLSFPVSASLNEQFSDPTLSGWIIVQGAWTTSVDGWLRLTGGDGSGTNILTHLLSTGQKSIRVKFDSTYLSNGVINVYWSGTAKAVSIYNTHIHSTGYTVTDVTFPPGIYTFDAEISTDGTSITQYFYYPNGTLFESSQTAAYTETATDVLKISYGLGTGAILHDLIDFITTSTVSPSSSNSITWSATDYIEGAAQTWSYAITDASWSDGSIKYVELYKDGAIIKPWTSCTLGICYDASYMTLQGQTGSQPLHLTTGVYTIYLKTGLLVGHTILSQATMTVYATAPSQMIVNSSYPSRIPFNIWLSTGYSHATGQIRIDVEAKSGGDWILQRTFTITSDPGYNSIWVNAPGDYRVTLFDLTFGLKLITKYFSAVYVDVPIESNISTSNLTIEKTTFYYGDQLVGYYAIDNNNWTNGNTPYIAIRNTTGGIISAVYKAVMDSQQKRFILGISDGNELATNRYRPGNNTIELRAFNTTGDRLLDSKYFQLADTDQDGNKLRTDKYKYCPNDQVLILASVPLQGYMTIANYNDLSRLLYNQSINGTDQSIIYKTKTPGNYLIRLLDYSGKQLRSADFVISGDCTAATATATPATPANKTDEMLGNGFFAAIIVLAAFASIGIAMGGGVGAVMGFSAGFIMDVYYGLLPEWALLLFAIIAITAFTVMFAGKVTGK